MKGKEGVSKVLGVGVLVLMGILFVTPEVFAGSGCRLGHRHHHRGHNCDHSNVIFSGKHWSVSIGGHRCDHCGRRYCRRRHHERVIIHHPPPVIITTIPHGCRKVIIDGRDYYRYNDTYYMAVTGGYQIVDRPHGRYSEEDRYLGDDDNDDYRPRQNRRSDDFTVNIPNRNGGYTAVTLKRSGSGYTGPQGEYYSEFPRVDQLKAMYEK